MAAVEVRKFVTQRGVTRQPTLRGVDLKLIRHRHVHALRLGSTRQLKWLAAPTLRFLNSSSQLGAEGHVTVAHAIAHGISDRPRNGSLYPRRWRTPTDIKGVGDRPGQCRGILKRLGVRDVKDKHDRAERLKDYQRLGARPQHPAVVPNPTGGRCDDSTPGLLHVHQQAVERRIVAEATNELQEPAVLRAASVAQGRRHQSVDTPLSLATTIAIWQSWTWEDPGRSSIHCIGRTDDRATRDWLLELDRQLCWQAHRCSLPCGGEAPAAGANTQQVTGAPSTRRATPSRVPEYGGRWPPAPLSGRPTRPTG